MPTKGTKHKVKTYTRRTATGIVTVREHTATNALQINRTVRSPSLKQYMARKASNRARLIQEARRKALANRY